MAEMYDYGKKYKYTGRVFDSVSDFAYLDIPLHDTRVMYAGLKNEDVEIIVVDHPDDPDKLAEIEEDRD